MLIVNTVYAYKLEPGDIFVSDGSMITSVEETDDGVWFETDDGDSGFAPTRYTKYQIY